MLNENWKKKIGIGQPVRYWQAVFFGLGYLALFNLFAIILVKQNRIDDIQQFALGYLTGIIGINLIVCVLDIEERLQPLEDKIHAKLKILAQKLTTRQEEEYKPDPTLLEDAMAVLDYDILTAIEDPEHTEYLTTKLMPNHDQKRLEEAIKNINNHKSSMNQPSTYVYSPPMPMSKQGLAREAMSRKD